MAVTVTAKWTLISNVKNFSYTGAAQTFTAPYTGYYKVELWGAQGGGSTTIPGAKGGYVSGTSNKITKNTSLYVYVGQRNTTAEVSSFNGSLGSNSDGFPGGGATDIRTVNGTWNSAVSLRSRVIVAAGGGSTSNIPSLAVTGHAGGLVGYSTTNPSTYPTPTGGTQVSGGKDSNWTYPGASIGYFGQGSQYGTGGGSGWYGGGGGYFAAGGGAGGSSYISGHTGSVAVTSTSSSSPKSGCTTGTTNNACSISPYGYTFTNTVMIDGAGYKWTNVKGALQQMPNPSGGYYASGVGHSGNGYARITWMGDTI